MTMARTRLDEFDRLRFTGFADSAGLSARFVDWVALTRIGR